MKFILFTKLYIFIFKGHLIIKKHTGIYIFKNISNNFEFLIKIY